MDLFPLTMQVYFVLNNSFSCQASDIISMDLIKPQTQKMLILGKMLVFGGIWQ
jgi:hypothetical protein